MIAFIKSAWSKFKGAIVQIVGPKPPPTKPK